LTGSRSYRAGAWTVVVAPVDQLPWADGVIYLGSFPGAADLLAPVLLEPDVPPDLLLGAVRELCAPDPGPFVVLPVDGTVTVVPLGSR
jgi:hypothetical protein